MCFVLPAGVNTLAKKHTFHCPFQFFFLQLLLYILCQCYHHKCFVTRTMSVLSEALFIFSLRLINYRKTSTQASDMTYNTGLSLGTDRKNVFVFTR